MTGSLTQVGREVVETLAQVWANPSAVMVTGPAGRPESSIWALPPGVTETFCSVWRWPDSVLKRRQRTPGATSVTAS
jgi:hypothetical protein